MIGKKNTGFTLIELMVAIAIISIVSIIAVPRFNDMIPRYRLKAAARNLQANMQKAKVRAIKEKNFKLATTCQWKGVCLTGAYGSLLTRF